MKLSPRSQPIVTPSWKSEFIQGYGWGLFRRGGAIDGAAARVSRHRHDAHAVGQAAVERLQFLVVEGFLPHHGRERAHNVLVEDRSVARNASPGVLLILTTESHEEMSDCLAQQLVLFRVSLFERSQLPNSRLVELVCLGSQAVGFSVVQRPYVGLGGGSDR